MMTSDFSLSDNRGAPVTQDVRGTATKAPDASAHRNPRATAYRTRRRRARHDLQEGVRDASFAGPMDNETVARDKIRTVP